MPKNTLTKIKTDRKKNIKKVVFSEKDTNNKKLQSKLNKIVDKYGYVGMELEVEQNSLTKKTDLYEKISLSKEGIKNESLQKELKKVLLINDKP